MTNNERLLLAAHDLAIARAAAMQRRYLAENPDIDDYTYLDNGMVRVYFESFETFKNLVSRYNAE